MRRYFSGFILILSLSMWSAKISYAVSCSLSVSPSYSLGTTEEDFTFWIGNTGEDVLKYVSLTVTAGDMEFHGANVDGWTTSVDPSQVVFTNATGVGANSTQDFVVTNGVGNAPDTIHVAGSASGDIEGVGTVSCGSTSVSLVTELPSEPEPTAIPTVITNTVTNTVTETKIETKTETVTKIITDTTPPVVRVDSLGKNVWESAPLITGSVSDDRGVAKVEYRIKEQEASWSSAGLEGDVGAKKIAFEFVSPVSLDGTYTVEVRGVDVFGNESVPKNIEFVIDQLLPTVGGGVISYGALPLYAVNGVVTVMAGREYEVVLYEAGGSDGVQLMANSLQWELQKMGTRGLWRGLVKFEESGEFASQVRAVDGAGNETEREWVKFRVIAVNQRHGELYSLDPTTKRFGLWEAEAYGQKQGELGWYVPRGEYYVQEDRVISQRIVMRQDGWIGGEWEIAPARWWEKLMRILRVADLHYSIKPIDHVTTPKPLRVAREKWIGEESIVYLGNKHLPWDSVARARARHWAQGEGARFVELEVQGKDDPKGE